MAGLLDLRKVAGVWLLRHRPRRPVPQPARREEAFEDASRTEYRRNGNHLRFGPNEIRTRPASVFVGLLKGEHKQRATFGRRSSHLLSNIPQEGRNGGCSADNDGNVLLPV